MAELELSAIARIYLIKLIVSIEELTTEVETLVKEREKSKIKINWQFPVAQARGKFKPPLRKSEYKKLIYNELVYTQKEILVNKNFSILKIRKG